MRLFIVQSLAQFLSELSPALLSDEWVEAFDQTKAYGAATGSLRSDEQTFIAKFWSANVISQYNRVGRDIAAARASAYSTRHGWERWSTSSLLMQLCLCIMPSTTTCFGDRSRRSTDRVILAQSQ